MRVTDTQGETVSIGIQIITLPSSNTIEAGSNLQTE